MRHAPAVKPPDLQSYYRHIMLACKRDITSGARANVLSSLGQIPHSIPAGFKTPASMTGWSPLYDCCVSMLPARNDIIIIAGRDEWLTPSVLRSSSCGGKSYRLRFTIHHHTITPRPSRAHPVQVQHVQKLGVPKEEVASDSW
ncbi:hypothetical protein KCP75_16870 [Salmonella enterica subsp. enterica]|nr:hypothetical protein KCP75_16870 [Salmonella enterica subsp. enterica]